MADMEYDYIVIGAGSAGCTIVTNLLERKKGRVLLLEAGGPDKDKFIHMPGGFLITLPRYSWPYATEPSPETSNRSIAIPQGRILGGSSSINAMLYVRGHRNDYDRWEKEYGCTGWGADEMLHYFRKSENNESLAGPYHGNKGHLRVSDNRYRHPLTGAFVRAGQQMGLEHIIDYNKEQQEGVGFFQMTTFDGERGSTSKTYLESVSDDPALKLQLKALVEKIEIKDGRAVSVVYRVDGQVLKATARAEIIVSAGAIGSAKILQLSGIGPKEDLDRIGVKVERDLPVGENFHDHLATSVTAEINKPISLYGHNKGLKAFKHGMQWMLYRSGVLTSPVLEGFAFIDSSDFGQPDIQFHFLPAIDAFDDPLGVTKGRTHGVTIKPGQLHPRSRGRVMIRSTDPNDLPTIDARFLSHPDDIKAQVRGVKLALKMLEQPALSDLITNVFSPSCHPDDDEGLADWVRATFQSGFHPVGTCRMGPDPKTSVVDLELKVHGVDALRVADTSVMPQIPGGNTNAPTIALAEKASDLICNEVR